MIVDCFIFFKEFQLLEARVKYLAPLVDRFLIVESAFTFTGVTKPLKLKEYIQDYLAQYAEKIVVLENSEYLTEQNFDSLVCGSSLCPGSIKELNQIRDTIHHNATTWLNDGYQRELLGNLVMKHTKHQDIILISDVDEIPSSDFIQALKPYENTLAFASMTQHRYDIHFLDQEPWIGTVATNRETLMTRGINECRFFTKRRLAGSDVVRYSHGGWHFTSFGSPAEIRQKIYAWGHQELNTPINRLLLTFRIRRGLDIFGRKMKIQYVKSPNLPTVLFKHFEQSHSYEFKPPSALAIIINTLAILLDKIYRGVCEHIGSKGTRDVLIENR
jgi:beta-1,4-mannosyl-glycoprotein beta-1,4-N-acetylglucosaminyltransferase